MAERKNTHRTFAVGRDDVGRRLDRLARKFLNGIPLGMIYGAIRRGDIRVGGKKKRGDYRVQEGDHLEIRSTLLQRQAGKTSHGATAPLPAWFTEAILFENDNLVAFNKPPGVLVHGQGSLQTHVLDYLREQLEESLSFVPGPLHRLDRNSSGLVLFGRSLTGASRFTTLLRSHAVTKGYLVLLSGKLVKQATWEDRLDRDTKAKKTGPSAVGRRVKCQVTPLLSRANSTLAVVSMQSGFTHQIRAQAAIHSHPLIGDAKYGSPDVETFLLHAAVLTLQDTDSILGFRTLTAPLPERALARLRSIFTEDELTAALREIPLPNHP